MQAHFDGVECIQGRLLKLEKQNRRLKQLGVAAFIVSFALIASGSMMASQDSQTSKAATTVKPLTNVDVIDLVHAGVSQEIVIAKINTSACGFDTSPATLKALKAANIPDAVILAMVKASEGQSTQGRSADSVQDAHPSSNPPKNPAAPEKQTDEKKREEVQKLNNDLDDCRLRAQNEYETKTNLVGTLTLTPIQRVYASNRLKQNLDAELKSCRSQYQSRLKALEGE